MTTTLSTSDEVHLVVLGPAFDCPGTVAVPAHGEAELRGRLGPCAAFDVRVVPGRLEDYAGLAPRLTMLRVFSYPDCSCEDLEHRPRGLGVPVEGRGVALMTGRMAAGSSIGVVVRNNTCDDVSASLSVMFLTIDDA